MNNEQTPEDVGRSAAPAGRPAAGEAALRFLPHDLLMTVIESVALRFESKQMPYTAEDVRRLMRQLSVELKAGHGPKPPDDQQVFARPPLAGGLVWSAELPTVGGWWWVKMPHLDSLSPSIHRLARQRAFGGRLCAFIGGHGWIPVDDTQDEQWRWAGPLGEPLEAPNVVPPANVRISDDAT